ncbi:thioredoxin domain-containing protein [Pedobacter sp. PAMC26386]|nr:thioredoxin domain-containing protein [Pedobacter sp. PAMC26386]
MMSGEFEKDNPIIVLSLLLKKLNVRVSSFTLNEKLKNHPYYPSLLSISDCLTEWSVPHISYQIDKDDYYKRTLRFPFVAHLQALKEDRFLIIYDIKDNVVSFSDHKNSNRKMPELEFLNEWDGIILYAEKSKYSGEPSYSSAIIQGLFNQARWPFLVAMMLILILAFLNYDRSLAFFCLLGVKVLGVIFSCFLLIHSINADNPFVQNLCGVVKKSNCNTILNSDAAKLTSWLSWSEVGAFYFTGSLIYLLYNLHNVSLLAIVNVLCLPYTIYSLVYQFRHKSWCILCCAIQAFLWLEAIIFFTFFSYTQTIDFSEAIALIFSFGLPIAVWSFLKPFFLLSSQTQPLKEQLKLFKYDANMFNQHLINQQYEYIPEDLVALSIGNPQAGTTITMISNLYCRPCGDSHKIIQNWLLNRDDFQLKIIFSVSTYLNDPRLKVVQHLRALQVIGDSELLDTALLDWYSRKQDYDSWAKKYPIEIEEVKLNFGVQQKAWYKQAGISSTPTFFINGHRLTLPYRLEDVEFLID